MLFNRANILSLSLSKQLGLSIDYDPTRAKIPIFGAAGSSIVNKKLIEAEIFIDTS